MSASPPDPPQASPPQAAPPQPASTRGFPWSTLLLLAVALWFFTRLGGSVPSEAPLGSPPPAVAGVLQQVVPAGASPAPLSSVSASRAELDLGALRGRVVMLEFYATWCGPCVRSLGELCQRELPAELSVVALSAPDSAQTVAQIEDFAAGLKFPTLVLDGRALEAYGVSSIPYAVVLDRSGQVAWKGNPSDPGCHEAIEAALARGGALPPAGD